MHLLWQVCFQHASLRPVAISITLMKSTQNNSELTARSVYRTTLFCVTVQYIFSYWGKGKIGDGRNNFFSMAAHRGERQHNISHYMKRMETHKASV